MGAKPGVSYYGSTQIGGNLEQSTEGDNCVLIGGNSERTEKNAP